MKRPFAAADSTSNVPTKSSESAKDCRKRKALRIQYLAESVRQREMTVLRMKHDIDKLLQLCYHIDQGEAANHLMEELGIYLPQNS